MVVLKKTSQDYCFVTGSDKDKTIEQIGLDMFVGAQIQF